MKPLLHPTSQNIQYLSISTNGYTTSIVRNLGLRTYPLPFDWVTTNIESIDKCLKDDFKQYHTNLKIIDNDKRHVIDEYGFLFKYDYPLYTTTKPYNLEYNQECLDLFIQNNKIHDIVIEKYKHRINNFQQLMNSTEPIICLCDYSITDVIKLRELFITFYNKIPENLYIINICYSPIIDHIYIPENIYHVNINTQNIYIWKYMIDLVLRHHKNKK
jgi:hypothetical protein